MRIIQLNAWGGKLQFQIPKFLGRENGDIVCLQEIHDLKGPSGALFVTLDELKEELGYQYSEMSPVYSFRYMNRDLEYGNAILSKISIISNDIIYTLGQYKKHFDMLEDNDVRNFQHAKFQQGGKSFHVINYHGSFIPGTKDGNADTEKQVNIICDYVSKLEGAVIITGDFNLVPGSQSLSRLNGLMRNLSLENGLTSTYSSFSINEVICDYIFVNQEVNVRKFYAAEDLISDHKPLVLDFDI